MPSSVIRQFHYHPDSEELDVLLTTGRRYRYFRVPAATADDFRAAFSKGRYFNARIRDAFEFIELAET